MNKDESLVETNHFKCNLSHKLKVPNFSRPDKSQLTKNTESYIQVVRNKFRNLKIQVMHMHKFKNNLNKNLQKSLQKLRIKTKNKEIVIGNSDKDGKTIVINYKDYISLITKALDENYVEMPYNEKEILIKMTKLKENISQILVDMW